MILTNQKIYEYATKLVAFNIEGKMPVKINFFLNKNINTLRVAAQEIDEARLQVAQQYGTPNEDGTSYQVPAENMAAAKQELNDLFSIEQEINLHIFKLDEFNNIELTMEQLSSIMFMIEE